MSSWRKQALFSPPAVGSLQEQKNDVHRHKDERRQHQGEAFVLLPDAGGKPSRLLPIPGRQRLSLEIPGAGGCNEGDLVGG